MRRITMQMRTALTTAWCYDDATAGRYAAIVVIVYDLTWDVRRGLGATSASRSSCRPPTVQSSSAAHTHTRCHTLPRRAPLPTSRASIFCYFQYIRRGRRRLMQLRRCVGHLPVSCLRDWTAWSVGLTLAFSKVRYPLDLRTQRAIRIS